MLLPIGCGGVENTLGRKPVHGSVTFDNKPLENGSITFNPFDVQPNSKTTSSGGLIKGGNYALDETGGLPPGKYTVIISATEATPANTETDPVKAMELASKTPPPKQLIPARYNSNTELVVEVKSSGDNKFDFTLEPGKGKK